MAETGGTQHTIMFIHGLWMTPLCWEHWIVRYQGRGHAVLAPAWPRMDVGEDALRADPSVLNGLGIAEIADHYDRQVRALDTAPILVGHSFGGLVVQLLLDRGLGAAGVALHAAPVKGVFAVPPVQLRANLPVLGHPGTCTRTVALTPEQFRYAFANTLTEEESRRAWERYHVPGPGRPIWQVVSGNLRRNPPNKVDLQNNQRAPLLFLAGGADRAVPAVVNRENARRYGRSAAVTGYREFPGRSHFTLGQPGWEEVADYALDWAVRAVAASEPVPDEKPVE